MRGWNLDLQQNLGQDSHRTSILRTCPLGQEILLPTLLIPWSLRDSET